MPHPIEQLDPVSPQFWATQEINDRAAAIVRAYAAIGPRVRCQRAHEVADRISERVERAYGLPAYDEPRPGAPRYDESVPVALAVLGIAALLFVTTLLPRLAG